TSSVLPKTIQLTNPKFPTENKTSTFTYDGNKIKSISSEMGKTEFTYNGNHIVNKVDYYMSGDQAVKYAETSYVYENGKLVTVNTISNGQTIKRYGYIHNNDGTVKKEIYLTDITGVTTLSSNSVMLNFVNGNLTKVVSSITNSV